MQKENWQWRNHFHTGKRKIDEIIDEEELMKNLDADWVKIKEFEKRLKRELGLKEKFAAEIRGECLWTK